MPREGERVLVVREFQEPYRCEIYAGDFVRRQGDICYVRGPDGSEAAVSWSSLYAVRPGKR